MSEINIGESVKDLSISDPFEEFDNVEFVIDNDNSVEAIRSGETVVGEKGVNEWFSQKGNGDTVDTETFGFNITTSDARNFGDVGIASSPAIVRYRDVLGTTITFNFNISAISGQGCQLWAFVGARDGKDATALVPVESHGLGVYTQSGSFSIPIKIGTNFVSQHIDSYIGLYFLVRCSGEASVTVKNISAKTEQTNTLVAKCPWATQAMALNVLKRLRGFRYSPFNATGARINPAAEIGDNVKIKNGQYSLFSQNTRFGSEFVSTISAPGEKELEHEFEYVPSSEREFKRTVATLRSEIDIRSGEIRAEVEKKVSSVNDESESFGWTLQSNNFTLYSSGQTVMRADKDGIKVTGEINATSGVIGGCVIRNGKLEIAAANIGNINASKITAGELSIDRIPELNSSKLGDNCVVPRTILGGAVSYGKVDTGVQSYLKQAGNAWSGVQGIQKQFANLLVVNTLQINGNLFVKHGNKVLAFRPIAFSQGTMRWVLGSSDK